MSLLQKLKAQAKQLKSESQVLILAYMDKRTPISAKILIGITVAYLLSPVDLIPDFIPVLGLLDDLIIVPALIAWSIKLIPATVLDDARKKLIDEPLLLRKSNWIFGCVIIAIWIFLIVILYSKFKYLWGS